MRLIKLKVRNIASLKGEHEINFHDIQRQSSLFAITGETGAGKSSILNSIGLALYGQIYKKNVNQIDVVTLGEKEGLIELIFQVKGKYYLADWRAKVRKQNGEFYSTPQTPVRNLYTIEGMEFSSPKNIATVSVSELLNLDFDQFCKCIILNQGEFAKFLMSSFTERKEILEKLYPGEMLESMGRELRGELDSLQKIKDGLEIELQTLKGDGLSGESLKEQKERAQLELNKTVEIGKCVDELDYHFVSLSACFDKYAENDKRIELIKKEMSDLTTSYNLLLKRGQEVTEQKDLAQKELEQKLPGLQILLKKEERFKNMTLQRKESEKKIELIKDEHNKILTKLTSVIETEEAGQKKLSEAKSQMTLPLQELKLARPLLNEVFDLFNEKELIQEDIRGKKERLQTLELDGKKLKAELEILEKKMTSSPLELKEKEKNLESRKKEISLQIELSHKNEIKILELKKSMSEILNESEVINRRITSLTQTIEKTAEDLVPIETSLKLQEFFSAAQVCIEHATSTGLNECPVCEGPVNSLQWGELKRNLEKTNLTALKNKQKELTLLFVQGREEKKILEEKNSSLNELKVQKDKELSELLSLSLATPPTLESIEQELTVVKKLIWENEGHEKELIKLKGELTKTRDLWGTLKSEMSLRETRHKELQDKLSSFELQLKDLVTGINREQIQILTRESRNLTLYLEIETNLGKFTQEKNYLLEQKCQTEGSLQKSQEELTLLQNELTTLHEELTQELKGIEASELIQSLNLKAKNTTLLWTQHEQEQKKQELQLKEFQSRLYELDKLTKDYDLQFSREIQTLRSLAVVDAPLERQETISLLSRFKTLSLELTSKRELFIPLKDTLLTEKDFYKQGLIAARELFASIKARLEDWEKLQDKILILSMKSQDINEKFERRERLFEVLGKDELRTFVLSLVEENLIEQTNQELLKLCQGRYEIVHQSRRMKMTPEFYILDKFREGGLRKVSTLSGGETFMVSLAMALGLAEMTRGQAEIDSLFIDEGFGTLDHDSLEDVLDMLQQIQTRGLMVGIISHIKALNTALPVNLLLSKKQDGTSTISLQIN